MRNNYIKFAVTSLILSGMIIQSGFALTNSIYQSNYSSMSLILKISFSTVCVFYIALLLSSVIGNYKLLKEARINAFLFFTCFLYSFEIFIHSVKFTFLPFEIGLMFNIPIFETKVGVGVNFLGLLFFVWLFTLGGRGRP